MGRKRYLVTGGAGFIGSHLVDHLLGLGADVAVLDDFSTGRRENLSASEDRCEVIEGSVTDPSICERAVDGVDVVFHQAALGSVPRSLEHPHRTHEVNATGTLNVLVAARDAGVRRVVYASSSSAYGETDEPSKHEEMVPRPKSPYAVAKLAGEQYCRAFSASYGLETVALRYFNVFGPRQEPDSQYAAVVPLFVTAALAGEQPLIFGDGEQSRDFTFVENVVMGNVLAAEAPSEAVGQVFNLGAHRRTTINELWERIAEATGAAHEPRHAAARPGDVRHSLASLDRARRILGYEPTVDVGEGLRRTVEWYAAAREGRSTPHGEPAL